MSFQLLQISIIKFFDERYVAISELVILNSYCLHYR